MSSVEKLTRFSMFLVAVGYGSNRVNRVGRPPRLVSSFFNTMERLLDYSSHFPIVGLDSTFYAIQPERNIEKWIDETPSHFRSL